ncbi:hypothetical protein ACFJIV_10525 [Mucilaginibacter sp. UC70_90]
MITKNEFLALYEKYMSGQCTDAEKQLLDTYRDEMQLADEVWDNEEVSEADVHARIWKKLSESRQKAIIIKPLKQTSYKWLWVAASLVAIAVLAGLLFIPVKKDNTTGTMAKNTKTTILPGSNKAYLTLANGNKIVLDDAKMASWRLGRA